MAKNIVSFSNAKIIQSGKTILTDVSVDVPDGSFVFLIGRTGSGKSSLIKTIYGDLQLAGGLGSVGDYDLTQLKRNQIPALRRTLGVVFQDFKLLPDRNIEDNLKFVLKATGWKDKKEISQRIYEVLDMVGIKVNKKKFPFELSGGEQQRIAIARALLNNPKLVEQSYLSNIRIKFHGSSTPVGIQC
jgi:cell division transport system ATP-binding protein